MVLRNLTDKNLKKIFGQPKLKKSLFNIFTISKKKKQKRKTMKKRKGKRRKGKK